MKSMHVGPKTWWWGYLWKLNAPLKCKIALWFALNNKLLTWENGVKHVQIGPSSCSLWENDLYCVSHIFIYFTYEI
jgi:hypothetical protein